MALKLKLGTVLPLGDPTQTGILEVAFKGEESRKVRYVTPYGNMNEGMVFMPPALSKVLCVEDDQPLLTGQEVPGIYYLGSLMGPIPGMDQDIGADKEAGGGGGAEDLMNVALEAAIATNPALAAGVALGKSVNEDGEIDASKVGEDAMSNYFPPTKPGLNSPVKGDESEIGKLEEEYRTFPSAFEGMFKGSGVVPQQMGISNSRGDKFMISDRGDRGIDPDFPDPTFMDNSIGIRSGGGQRIQCVDTPANRGLLMSHDKSMGEDYMFWASTQQDSSPYSSGELNWKTSGPMKLRSSSSILLNTPSGKNIEIVNDANPMLTYSVLPPFLEKILDAPHHHDATYPPTSVNPTSWPNSVLTKPLWPNGEWLFGLGDAGTSGYTETRKGVYGNESTGCVKIKSKYNNIAIEALAPDSVIRVMAPESDTRVIVETGGTVDIVAKGKITLQSDTEIEMNAPEIDINASLYDVSTGVPIPLTGNVYINGGRIDLNMDVPLIHPPARL